MNALKPILVIVAISFFSSIFAQDSETYKQGYIVLSDTGEKIDGIIHNGDWKKTPKEILFGASKKSYSIDQLESFEVQNIDGTKSKFIRADVDMEMSPYVEELLECNTTFKIEKNRIFLETLQEGEITFYQHIAQDRYHFYIKKGDGEIEPLLYKRFLDCSVDGTQRVPETKDTYQNQLRQLFKDCGKLTEGYYTSLKYSSGRITSIINKYNECMSYEVVKKVKRKSRMKLHGYASVGYIQNVYKDDTYSDFTITVPVVFSVGVNSEFFIKNSNNTSSVLLGMGFKFGKSNEYKLTEDIFIYNPDIPRDARDDISALDIQLMYRQRLKKNRNLSFGGGIASSYNFNKSFSSLVKGHIGPKFGIYYAINKLELSGTYGLMLRYSDVDVQNYFRHIPEITISYNFLDTAKGND